MPEKERPACNRTIKQRKYRKIAAGTPFLVMLVAAVIIGLGAVYLYGNHHTDGAPLMEPAPNGVEEVPATR